MTILTENINVCLRFALYSTILCATLIAVWMCSNLQRALHLRLPLLYIVSGSLILNWSSSLSTGCASFIMHIRIVCWMQLMLVYSFSWKKHGRKGFLWHVTWAMCTWLKKYALQSTCFCCKPIDLVKNGHLSVTGSETFNENTFSSCYKNLNFHEFRKGYLSHFEKIFLR